MTMRIRLRYFGQLQDVTGKSEEFLAEKFTTIGKLRIFLIERYPKLGDINFKMAQNNKIDIDSSQLNGALIDLLPPFSGG